MSSRGSSGRACARTRPPDCATCWCGCSPTCPCPSSATRSSQLSAQTGQLRGRASDAQPVADSAAADEGPLHLADLDAVGGVLDVDLQALPIGGIVEEREDIDPVHRAVRRCLDQHPLRRLGLQGVFVHPFLGDVGDESDGILLSAVLVERTGDVLAGLGEVAEVATVHPPDTAGEFDLRPQAVLHRTFPPRQHSPPPGGESPPTPCAVGSGSARRSSPSPPGTPTTSTAAPCSLKYRPKSLPGNPSWGTGSAPWRSGAAASSSAPVPFVSSERPSGASSSSASGSSVAVPCGSASGSSVTVAPSGGSESVVPPQADSTSAAAAAATRRLRGTRWGVRRIGPPAGSDFRTSPSHTRPGSPGQAGWRFGSSGGPPSALLHKKTR